MTNFLWAFGHGVALVDLLLVTPQPKCQGLKTTQRTHSLSGAVHEIGPYTEWVFELFESEDDYAALLAPVNLDSNLFVDLTIYTRNQRLSSTFVRYNARAILPEIGPDGGLDVFPRGLTILHKKLIAI